MGHDYSAIAAPMLMGCPECGEYYPYEEGTHTCPPFDGYSSEDRAHRIAARSFLCKEDKDQLDRIEGHLMKLAGLKETS